MKRHTTHTIGGTKLTARQYQIVQELRKHGLAPIPTSGYHSRVNPYSQQGCALNHLAVVVFDWIVSPERGDNINAGKESKALWDAARLELFRMLWIDEYWILLD